MLLQDKEAQNQTYMIKLQRVSQCKQSQTSPTEPMLNQRIPADLQANVKPGNSSQTNQGKGRDTPSCHSGNLGKETKTCLAFSNVPEYFKEYLK